MDTEDYHYFTSLGELHTVPVTKTRSCKRKGSLQVDWYLCRNAFFRLRFSLSSLPKYLDDMSYSISWRMELSHMLRSTTSQKPWTMALNEFVLLYVRSI